MKFNRLGAFTLGVVITAVSVGAVSFVNAAGDATIKACANKTSGAMRYISKGSCKKTETPLSWNQMGQQGLSGATGPTGSAGTSGSQGTKGLTGDAVLANLNCSTNEAIKWSGTAWECGTDQYMFQSGTVIVDTPSIDVTFQDSFTYRPNVVLTVIGYNIGNTCQLSVVTVTGFTARCDNPLGFSLTTFQWIAIGSLS